MDDEVEPTAQPMRACTRGDLAAFEAFQGRYRGTRPGTPPAPPASVAAPRDVMPTKGPKQDTRYGRAQRLDVTLRLFVHHQDVEAQTRLLQSQRKYPHYVLPPDLDARSLRP